MEKNKSYFDFDGTLISVNSFPLWILFSAFYALISLRLGLFGKILKLLFQRKIQQKISHYEFKKALISLNISEKSDENFVQILTVFKRKNLVEELKKLHSENHEIVISSAAPENYLKKIIAFIFPEIHQNLMIIGSNIVDNELIDNYKEQKLINLHQSGFLAENEMLKNVFTDSWDDVSLAYRCENLILIAPKPKCKAMFLADSALNSKIKIQ